MRTKIEIRTKSTVFLFYTDTNSVWDINFQIVRIPQNVKKIRIFFRLGTPVKMPLESLRDMFRRSQKKQISLVAWG